MYMPKLLLKQLLTMMYLFPYEWTNGLFQWTCKSTGENGEFYACYWVSKPELLSRICTVLKIMDIPFYDGPVKGDEYPLADPRQGRKFNYGILLAGAPHENAFHMDQEWQTAIWWVDRWEWYRRRAKFIKKKPKLKQYHKSELWLMIEKKVDALRDEMRDKHRKFLAAEAKKKPA